MTEVHAARIPAETFTNNLLPLLDEVFESHRGIILDVQTSLFEMIDDLSAEEASRRAGPGRPTLAAQVDHVRFYLDVMLAYLESGASVDIDWQRIWNTVGTVNAAEWKEIRSRLHASHARVRERLASLAWNEPRQVGGAMAIVAHTAYHLGQIVLTRKLLESRAA